MTTKDYYAGTTIRVTLADLFDIDTGPVTTGATVTVKVVDNRTDATLSTVTADPGDDDWSVDITLPETVGKYRLAVEAIKGSSHGRWETAVNVLRFP